MSGVRLAPPERTLAPPGHQEESPGDGRLSHRLQLLLPLHLRHLLLLPRLRGRNRWVLGGTTSISNIFPFFSLPKVARNPKISTNKLKITFFGENSSSKC